MIKGFKYVGSTILGYKLTTVVDLNGAYAKNLKVANHKSENTTTRPNFNCDRKLRKVTYRKFNKTANRE